MEVMTSSPAQAVVTKNCCTATCGAMFQEGHGHVRDLATLYKEKRGSSKVESKRPLTSDEVLSSEVCAWCANDLRKQGLRVFPASSTIRMMETWRAKNIRLEAEQREFIEKRNLELARQKGDNGPVAKVFAEVGPRKERAKKGRPYVGSPKPKFNPAAPKKYGEYRPAPKPAKKEKNKGKEKNKK